MKTYDFIYATCCWCDVGTISVELTDEQAERLEKIIKVNTKRDIFDSVRPFEQEESLIDVYRFVWKTLIEDTANTRDPDELREFGDEESSLEACANAYLNSNAVIIFYPDPKS